MIAIFDGVSSREGLSDFSLRLNLDKVTQLYDPSENLSRAILYAMVGLDELHSGEIYFDQVPLQEFIADGPQIRKLGYVFDEGIMLSNLSLKENLMLPLRWLNPHLDEARIASSIQSWMQSFELDLDLNKRPVAYHPGQLKLMGFVRTLLIEPKVMLIDDPFFLLNKIERKVLLKVLDQLRKTCPMLIASIDDEFGVGFADEVIDLSPFETNFKLL
ncbi:MAG: ATP-binding cassette domain-containing protein [Candidatus Cloacimonadaceae bacterium]|nr:ATP-binding cassette domain-containing protein [Candidatus Cloacimonadota bacterium]MDY0127732.1 ATP-binding cassette domain-containing protein [Candidatus Cloacimonadaceae bacterium]MCB5255425.1 ATP-binding cassette domain-containing protein [Candidatus Cloacimonadota bacterium]MCK9178722.1 ATP-binding cassette domain-containing protein [Candidatus Cloacimonadota bacterium]MCK9242560.1 ATP-binding cassette domain-containing protein [Candidatus Cloacimonadota bacterium]